MNCLRKWGRTRKGLSAVCVAASCSAGWYGAAVAAQPASRVQVQNTFPTNDARPSPIVVRILAEGRIDIDVAAEVIRPDGLSVPETARSGGRAAAVGDASVSGGAVELVTAPPAPLADGVYAERIHTVARLVDSGETIGEVAYRYFEVLHGQLSPITSTEYSERTADRDSSGDLRPVPGPAGSGSRSFEFSPQVRSGDTGVPRESASERAQP